MQRSHPKLKVNNMFFTAIESNASQISCMFPTQLKSDVRIGILLAAWHGHTQVLQDLMNFYETQNGGRQDKSLYGEALVEACEFNHWHAVELLLSHNASADFMYHAPLIRAISVQSLECTNILLNHLNPQQINKELIETIVQHNNVAGFQMLLTHVPGLHCSTSKMIHAAIKWGKPSWVQAVIDSAPILSVHQQTDFIPILCLAMDKKDYTSASILIKFLHEDTLNAAAPKLSEWNHRKQFQMLRDDYKSNQILHQVLSNSVDGSAQMRQRKM